MRNFLCLSLILYARVLVAEPFSPYGTIENGYSEEDLGAPKTATSSFGLNVIVDKKSVQVGEEISVTIKASHPSGYRIDPGELKRGLLEYFGYGMTPFSLAGEEPISSTLTKTEVRYRLIPNIKGQFDITLGVVTMESATGKENVSVLSPVVPINVTLGTIDTDYLPPPPSFLLINPLLPVEIDMELKQKLMSGRHVLMKERNVWEQLFFMRKVPFYVFPVILVVFIAYILASAFFGTRSKNALLPEKDVDAILKALLEEMRSIQEQQKEGIIRAEEALVQMQKALVDCFELRLNLPATSMTVEELRKALINHPVMQGRSLEDIDSLLDLSLGIKFGKQTVERDKAIALMERALKSLEGLIYNFH